MHPCSPSINPLIWTNHSNFDLVLSLLICSNGTDSLALEHQIVVIWILFQNKDVMKWEVSRTNFMHIYRDMAESCVVHYMSVISSCWWSRSTQRIKYTKEGNKIKMEDKLNDTGICVCNWRFLYRMQMTESLLTLFVLNYIVNGKNENDNWTFLRSKLSPRLSNFPVPSPLFALLVYVPLTSPSTSFFASMCWLDIPSCSSFSALFLRLVYLNWIGGLSVCYF